MKIFRIDYDVLAHEKVMTALTAQLTTHHLAYGHDAASQRAKKAILEACETTPQDHEVYFFVGGTQVNACALDFLLRPYESVICIETGHIETMEAGSVEATGHKLEIVQGKDGKMTADRLAEFMEAYQMDHAREHRPIPRVVYISQTTELGGVYTIQELRALRRVCDRYELKLFVDGARMIAALASDGAAQLEDLAEVAEAFTIGGTKAGLLLGEALILKKGPRTSHLIQAQKRFGALLAKGYILGIQFETLFGDGLWQEIGQNMVSQAQRIAQALKSKGIHFVCDSPSNQLFPIFEAEQLAQLEQDFAFDDWAIYEDGRRAKRICTSFATKEEDVVALIQAIEKL